MLHPPPPDGAATASVQPSIVEGFGLPPVEAAHYGTPVMASDIRVFHEVGGESATYCDPKDPADLARLMSLIKTEAYPYSLAYRGAPQGSSSESQ